MGSSPIVSTDLIPSSIGFIGKKMSFENAIAMGTEVHTE